MNDPFKFRRRGMDHPTAPFIRNGTFPLSIKMSWNRERFSFVDILAQLNEETQVGSGLKYWASPDLHSAITEVRWMVI